MIPTETMQLWQDYLASEQVRVRQDSLEILERFITALLKLPTEVWHPWARDLARRVVDEHYDIPIRLPLFRGVLFPALRAGLETSTPGSARWLAGFAQSLYKSPSCRDQLSENLQSQYGLLLRAVSEDPSDIRAKKGLRSLMRSRFDYALHELPSAVLYGQDGANIAQCDELLTELSTYERLTQEIGSDEADQELITEARFHIPAYRRYLEQHTLYTSYEQFLSVHGLSKS